MRKPCIFTEGGEGVPDAFVVCRRRETQRLGNH
jgi:hypothetical protein